MIGYLHGEVSAVWEDRVLLLTAGGVGYELHLPLAQLSTPPQAGAEARFYVVSIVRQDHFSLYGFETLAGKQLFESLITVSGIGPKVALAMLSAFGPQQVQLAITAEDVALLASIPGIGKKTAARLCVELSDRLKMTAPQDGTQADSRTDLISALTNLGFPEKNALTVLSQIPKEIVSFSEKLKHALALLGKAP